ncbi:MAG: fibronectin type III-like domain-contianing protein, partial [Bifidobacteriaceae bacterium]|nr:fibronectin type III-like domain-contianing protein [Bifidobacteriaceae bacterium]
MTNTGDRSGKEVVQVYYGAPQGLLGKPAKSLVAYAKTNLLDPGVTETLEITWQISEMASYDDAGKTGNKSAYVLEAGDYPIYIGSSVRDTVVAGTYQQAELEVTSQKVETLAIAADMPNTAQRDTWRNLTIPAESEGGAATPAPYARWTAKEGPNGSIVLDKWTDTVPLTTRQAKTDRIMDSVNAIDEIVPLDQLPTVHTSNPQYKLIDVYTGRATWAQFLGQMTLTEIVMLSYGFGTMDPPTSVLGTAGVLGGYTADLQELGITPETLADGPSGIRMAESATLFPIGTVLASTWNEPLVEEMLAKFGAEMVLNGTSSTLSPGMNIHRDAICGRNFEYFSEDPLLAGTIGGAYVRGIQSQGVAATPKHYAANNQETSRGSGNSQISERALREIYLKAFEVMVKTSKPRMVMTSYNMINAVNANVNWELVNGMLRGEFGFDGLVMTDWGGAGSGDPTGLTGDASRVRAGVNVLEQGSTNYATVVNSINASTNNHLLVAEAELSAVQVLTDVMKSAVFRKANHLQDYSYASGEYEPAYRYFQVAKQSGGDPTVDAIYLDGNKLTGFDPNDITYSVFTGDLNAPLPEVTASAAASVTVTVTQATAASRTAIVLAKAANGNETRYRISFNNDVTRPLFHPQDSSADLKGIAIDGQPLLNFYPSTYFYQVYVADAATAVVTPQLPAGVTADVTRDGNTVYIRSETATQAKVYRLFLTTIDPAKKPQTTVFNSTTLPAGWNVGNPTTAENVQATADGVVIKPTAAAWGQGADPDLRDYVWTNAQGNNWTISAKIKYDKLPLGAQSGEFGLMAYDGLDRFVKLSVQGWQNFAQGPARQTDGARWRLLSYVTGTPQSAASSNIALPTQQNPNTLPALENGTAWFRLVKDGDNFYAYRSTNGSTWTATASFQWTQLAEPKIAVFNTAREHGDITKAPTITVESVTVDAHTPADYPAPPLTQITANGTTQMWADSEFYRYRPGVFTNLAGAANFGANVDFDKDPTSSHATLGTSEFAGAYYNIYVNQAGYYTLTPR